MNESRRMTAQEGEAFAKQLEDTLPVAARVRFTVVYERRINKVARFRIRRHTTQTVRREGGASETP